MLVSLYSFNFNSISEMQASGKAFFKKWVISPLVSMLAAPRELAQTITSFFYKQSPTSTTPPCPFSSFYTAILEDDNDDDLFFDASEDLNPPMAPVDAILIEEIKAFQTELTKNPTIGEPVNEKDIELLKEINADQAVLAERLKKGESLNVEDEEEETFFDAHSSTDDSTATASVKPNYLDTIPTFDKIPCTETDKENLNKIIEMLGKGVWGISQAVIAYANPNDASISSIMDSLEVLHPLKMFEFMLKVEDEETLKQFKAFYEGRKSSWTPSIWNIIFKLPYAKNPLIYPFITQNQAELLYYLAFDVAKMIDVDPIKLINLLRENEDEPWRCFVEGILAWKFDGRDLGKFSDGKRHLPKIKEVLKGPAEGKAEEVNGAIPGCLEDENFYKPGMLLEGLNKDSERAKLLVTQWLYKQDSAQHLKAALIAVQCATQQ